MLDQFEIKSLSSFCLSFDKKLVAAEKRIQQAQSNKATIEQYINYSKNSAMLVEDFAKNIPIKPPTDYPFDTHQWHTLCTIIRDAINDVKTGKNLHAIVLTGVEGEVKAPNLVVYSPHLAFHDNKSRELASIAVGLSRITHSGGDDEFECRALKSNSPYALKIVVNGAQLTCDHDGDWGAFLSDIIREEILYTSCPSKPAVDKAMENFAENAVYFN